MSEVEIVPANAIAAGIEYAQTASYVEAGLMKNSGLYIVPAHLYDLSDQGAMLSKCTRRKIVRSLFEPARDGARAIAQADAPNNYARTELKWTRIPF